MTAEFPKDHSSQSASELNLVNLSIKGDKDAFGRLYAAYFPKIVSFLAARTNNPELAYDLAQDTFEKALGAIERFDGELKFQGWLFKIAKNTYIDRLRRQRPLTSLDTLLATRPEFENQYAELDQPLETTILSLETRKEIADVLARLNPKHTHVLILRDYFYLSYEEIAQRLKTTRAAVKSILSNARRNFRKAWNKNQNSAKVVCHE